ncbi:carbohydrate kinase family protein [Pararhodobacter sp.]|uniref:carbohydrate kinase family protein n=1 Tax=Pararhodobacter sp. TaxID=2127056 RepID=UPI002AFE8F74|nr:carbohydrate kinase family protein [Pararhodobacter sp.]
MSQLVVTGYASLDYAVGLDGQALGDTTTLIARRDPQAWPRAGGCPTYIAAAAVRAGQNAAPVMWVGSGAEGQRFNDLLAGQGVPTEGIGVTDSARSPTSMLIYQADGSCMCLYDPALDRRERLTEAQRGLIAQASHLCISVGPPQLMDQILDACPTGARLYWAVKNDPDAFPPALRARLSTRADVIFCNASEVGLIGPTQAVIVETRGARGVAVRQGSRSGELPTQAVEIKDATGAGDTFAGGYIAAEMAGADKMKAAQAGLEAAAALLNARLERMTT